MRPARVAQRFYSPTRTGLGFNLGRSLFGRFSWLNGLGKPGFLQIAHAVSPPLQVVRDAQDSYQTYHPNPPPRMVLQVTQSGKSSRWVPGSAMEPGGRGDLLWKVWAHVVFP